MQQGRSRYAADMQQGRSIVDSTSEVKLSLIYNRLSEEDDPERKQTSMDNALRYIREMLERDGFQIVKEYTDWDEHGWDSNRKELLECKSHALRLRQENPHAQIAIGIKAYSRLARDLGHQETFIKSLESQKINVKCLENPTDNRLTRQVLGAVAENYIHDLRTQSARRQAELIKQGYPVMPPCFGYRADKDKTSKTHKNWLVNKREADKVREVFRLKQEGKDWIAICKELGIGKNLYYGIIGNKSKYLGYPFFYKNHYDETGRVIKKERITYKGSYEPILI